MLKKVFTIILISILLCGCTKNKQEVLTFSSWGSVTEVSIIKKIINDFELKNPDIKINFMHIPQNYFQKIHLLFASNTAPDVLFINNLYLPVYQKELENLDNIIERERDDINQMIEDILNGKNFVDGWQDGWNENLKAYLIQAGILGEDGVSKGWAYLETKYDEIRAEVNALGTI